MGIKFLKIDILKTQKLWYMLLLPLFILLFFQKGSTTPAIFGLGYSLFIGLVMATTPANSEVKGERGFLQMLPAKPGEDILGHFLFGAVCIILYGLLSLVVILIARIINPELAVFSVGGKDITGFYPVMFGIALFIAGVEIMILTVFRYKSLQVQQLLRIIPGFIFFFGMMQVSNRAEAMQLPDHSFGMGPGVIAFLAVSIVLFVLMAKISAFAASKRG